MKRVVTYSVQNCRPLISTPHLLLLRIRLVVPTTRTHFGDLERMREFNTISEMRIGLLSNTHLQPDFISVMHFGLRLSFLP
jgi:hypothetical protein